MIKTKSLRILEIPLPRSLTESYTSEEDVDCLFLQTLGLVSFVFNMHGHYCKTKDFILSSCFL